MKIIFPVLFLATVLAGCAQSDVARHDGNGQRATQVAQRDYFKERRTITGSNIPLAKGQLPIAQVSATTPAESVSRDRPSLYPVEPVVGATQNSEPRTEPVNVGAGPAGSNPVLPLDQGN